MVGEELLHAFGFDGTEAPIAQAASYGWIEIDRDYVDRVTGQGQRTLDPRA